MENQSRPLDTLNRARNKTVMADLKNGTRYVGKLVAFDIHINTVLEDAEEHKNGELVRKLGTVFIRGDAITIITPAQERKQWEKEQQVWVRRVGRRPTFIVDDAVATHSMPRKSDVQVAAMVLLLQPESIIGTRKNKYYFFCSENSFS